MFFEMCRCFPFRLVPSPILWGPPCFKGHFKNVFLAAIMRRCTTCKFSRMIHSYCKAVYKKTQLDMLSSYIILLCTEFRNTNFEEQLAQFEVVFKVLFTVSFSRGICSQDVILLLIKSRKEKRSKQSIFI